MADMLLIAIATFETSVANNENILLISDHIPLNKVSEFIKSKVIIEKISDSKKEDTELLGYLLLKAGDIARELGVEEAFRLVVNNGAGAQQTVFHLHIHLIAGREFSWPPG